MTDAAISTLAPVVGTRAACAALGETRAALLPPPPKSPAPERPARRGEHNPGRCRRRSARRARGAAPP